MKDIKSILVVLKILNKLKRGGWGGEVASSPFSATVYLHVHVYRFEYMYMYMYVP